MIQVDEIQKAFVEEVRKDSRKVTALGILALGLGVFGLFYASLMTVTSLFVFGAALIIGGVVHLFNAVKYRDYGGLLVDTPIGITETVVGALLLSKPGASLLGLTLVTAAFLIISGVFRTIVAASLKPPSWGWPLASGVASILLGVMVWAEWPSSSLWLLGTFVSVYLILDGWSYIMIGMAVRKEFPKPKLQPAA